MTLLSRFNPGLLVRLALLSLKSRALAALLTVLAIAFSVVLLLGVEKVRTGARQSFADTVSGTDLIVGARTGSLQLLLYSVFRIGNATNNLTWQSYQEIAARPEVAWTVPMSLGDSHRGFRVLGTSTAYFERYRYRRGQSLVFREGKPFADVFDTVLGADVAATLGYRLGDPIVLAHGTGAVGFLEHKGQPFLVTGLLAKTGTPVDRTVHVSVEAITAIHVGWERGVPEPGGGPAPDDLRQRDLTPATITAALIGLKSKVQTFKVQRAVNDYRAEPLSAIIPGAALQELWSLVGTAETALGAISAMVVVTALLGMVTMILTTLNERRREMALLRAVGAGPGTIAGLLTAEAFFLTLAGVIGGLLLLYAGLLVLQPILDRNYGLYLPVTWPSSRDVALLAGVLAAGLLAGLLPAFLAYRTSLADGMTVAH
jgi:putative ABC transport system permease protein